MTNYLSVRHTWSCALKTFAKTGEKNHTNEYNFWCVDGYGQWWTSASQFSTYSNFNTACTRLNVYFTQETDNLYFLDLSGSPFWALHYLSTPTRITSAPENEQNSLKLSLRRRARVTANTDKYVQGRGDSESRLFCEGSLRANPYSYEVWYSSV